MQHELLELEENPEIVSFGKLYQMIFRMKWFIIACVSLFAVASIFYAISKPDVYRAEGLYVPAKDSAGGGLSKLAGQFGGLASMAGVSLGGGKGDDNAVAIELLKSRSFLQNFIQKHELLPLLLAAKKWDKENNTIVYDRELYDPTAKKWLRIPIKGQSAIPTAWEGYEMMRSLISIEYMMKKGMLKISITYLSPEISALWLGLLVQDLNDYWRQKDKQEAQNSVEFLNEQVEYTHLSEMRSIFYSMIAEQTQQILLTEVRKEYLFKTLAAVVVPEQKYAPSRALLVIAGTFIGGVLSLIISFIYVSVRR